MRFYKFMLVWSSVTAIGCCFTHQPICVVLNTLCAMHWLSQIERVRA